MRAWKLTGRRPSMIGWRQKAAVLFDGEGHGGAVIPHTTTRGHEKMTGVEVSYSDKEEKSARGDDTYAIQCCCCMLYAEHYWGGSCQMPNRKFEIRDGYGYGKLVPPVQSHRQRNERMAAEKGDTMKSLAHLIDMKKS